MAARIKAMVLVAALMLASLVGCGVSEQSSETISDSSSDSAAEAELETAADTALASTSDTIVVACIGDSITYGQGVYKTRDVDSYPAILQVLLGEDYVVNNLGNPGSTLTPETNKCYTDLEEYQTSLELGADISIIMLGTNDAKGQYWDAAKYMEAYEALISAYLDINPDMRIVLMLPPTVYSEDTASPEYFKPMEENIDAYVCDCVLEIAEEYTLETIDLHSFTADHPEWFADGLHPNKEGNTEIANYIYDVIMYTK